MIDVCVSKVELAECICSSPQLIPITALTSDIQFNVTLEEKVGKREYGCYLLALQSPGSLLSFVMPSPSCPMLTS